MFAASMLCRNRFYSTAVVRLKVAIYVSLRQSSVLPGDLIPGFERVAAIRFVTMSPRQRSRARGNTAVEFQDMTTTANLFSQVTHVLLL